MIITNLVTVLVREAVEFIDLRLLGPGPALLRDLHSPRLISQVAQPSEQCV